MKGIYRFAEKNIEIQSIHEQVHEYCKDYIVDGEPDFFVKINQSDIDFERKKSNAEAYACGQKPVNYSDSYLEELAVYRKIAEQMVDYNTFLFHGSAVSVDGEAYLFTAKSGTGKSTHTRLWREYLGNRAVMVNDDKPLIKIFENQILVYGTPYNGKHRLGNNISVPLKAVCIIRRAEDNSIVEISSKEAFAIMLQQVYRPASGDRLLRTLKLLDNMIERVKLYSLGCNMDISAAQTAYNGMK